MKRLLAIMCLTFGIVGVATPLERSFRCDSHLVRIGDDKLTVLEKCGEPIFREVVSGALERRVEQWFYKRGVRQFTRILTFEGTRLTRIETITQSP